MSNDEYQQRQFHNKKFGAFKKAEFAFFKALQDEFIRLLKARQELFDNPNPSDIKLLNQK